MVVATPPSTLIVNDNPAMVRLECDPRGLLPEQAERIRLLHETWTHSLQWLFLLKWGLKREGFNIRLKKVRLFKPFGEVLLGLLEVCYELHPICSLGQEYPTAIAMFQAAAQELYQNDCWICLNGDPAGTGKWASITQGRKELEAIRNGENPLDPDREPHSFRLYQAAMSCVAIPSFDKVWRRFLGTWATWYKKQESPDYVAMGGDLKTVGRGKARVKKKGGSPKRKRNKGFKP